MISAREKGKQHCRSCGIVTLHIPKMGLVAYGRRLCSVCGIANDLPADPMDEFDPDELREEQRLDDWREFEKNN